MFPSVRPVLASLLSLVLPAASLFAASLTARVESPNGAPRILVNGQPVRARMFFGAPGSSALPIGPDWQKIDFDFTAADSADTGTMHFRFGHGAGDVYLDQVQVTEVGQKSDVIPLCDFEGGQGDFDRDWTSWPQGAANTVGKITVESQAGAENGSGLHVKLTAPPDGQWPDFHLYHRPVLHFAEGHHYHVQLWAKAVPARSLFVEFYQPGQPFVHLGGPADPFPDQIKMAAKVGVHFITFPIGLPWPKPGETENFTSEDAACHTVLAADPRALLIPRIPMNPPAWWREAHPDEVMQWENGRRDAMVPASPLYRHDAAERLTALVKHLEEKFGDHMAGYHPVGQNTGEWFYEDTWKQPLNGYAPADLREWRKWLRAHYHDDEALRHAWNDTGVSFDTASVPTPAARHAAPAGIFRDPKTGQALIDWAEFQQQSMADCVCEIAHAARQASAGKKLVLFFYGISPRIRHGGKWPRHLRPLCAAPRARLSGHRYRLLADFLFRSRPRRQRALHVRRGKCGARRQDVAQRRRHAHLPGHRHAARLPRSRHHPRGHKCRTHPQCRPGIAGATSHVWMDLGATGWFRDRGMWRQMAKLKALDDAMLQPPTPFRPEIAAVIDAPSMWRVAPGGQAVTGPCVTEARSRLGRVGAPYGQYLLDDVAAGKVHAKLYVFLNAWNLSTAQRHQLRDATRGSVCVWCYAPGYFDNGTPSLAAMQDLTGFHLRALGDVKAWITPVAGNPATLHQPFGLQHTVSPLFALDGHAEDILYTYPDGSGAVAFRKRDDGQGASLFVGAPGLTSELLRFAAHRAGVHLYTETDCNVYANGPFVAIHATQNSNLQLNVGKAGPVTDVLTGQTVGQGPVVSLPVLHGDTRVLKIGP
ncbi:hypothetical protein CfE428DRAFT_1032 [Chthoniobacter flavus Ellin428]|uniref:Glycoside hydrolase family 42 N-terminal domain-containing protein n=1 Tax=Chthoniobacter flavus Ellin428 TaxID=497964 RepID=B4CWJ4_9BACT|nr:beta-galactosidase [Chthoniobacter flavus]EDY21786.1 hypothetical protein CfE428DRAFT_1032 [Chthoniobacter flavus Ellin428]